MSLINEAFKELKGIDLDEELFSFDEKGARDLSYFLDDTSDPVLDIVDPLATDEEELQPNYEGNVICQCCVCKQLIYKKPEDIVIDEETQNANVGEECPHCYNTRDFKVIGQVEPYFDKDELKVTVDDDEVEVEDDETEEVTESLNESWEDVYKQFTYIVDRNLEVKNKDPNQIEKQINALYAQHKGEKDWDFAYKRWMEGSENLDEDLDDDLDDEEDEEEFVIDERGNEITSIQDARKWLNKQTEEYGNTYFFPDNIKRVLNKLVEVFGNTYFWFREGINEDTIKQGNKWVNKGKAGTHGTFRTKKAADAQRKAMYASGYKGESLKEDLDPALVAKMDKESFVNYATVRKGWTTEEAEDYLKTYFDEALDEKLTVEVTEEDINHFDEDTGDVIVDKTKFVGKDVQKGDYVTLKFTDENEDADTQDYKFVEETEDGFKLEWIGTKELHEDFQKATVETGSSILSMESDDSGKVTVTSEPRKAEEGGDETIAPVSDEVMAEIEENNSEDTEGVEAETEETVEETTEEDTAAEEETPEEGEEEEATEEEISVGEFEESYFNDLGKKYLQEVYNNVTSYETTKGSIDGNKIKLEGIISFKSGKKAKTEFYFEGHSVTKAGKIKFLGENAQITSKKNAFTLTGSVNKGKLLAESLTYNYRAKDATTGKTVREYGTVKR